jgi:hypothetical protein
MTGYMDLGISFLGQWYGWKFQRQLELLFYPLYALMVIALFTAVFAFAAYTNFQRTHGELVADIACSAIIAVGALWFITIVLGVGLAYMNLRRKKKGTK